MREKGESRERATIERKERVEGEGINTEKRNKRDIIKEREQRDIWEERGGRTLREKKER